MTEIKILKNKIIFNGHADTLDACNAITSLVNAMKESPDFKTIEVRNGYAEFECIKDLEEKLFSPTQEEQFKSDMDALADSINTKSGLTGKKTIAQMKNAVDGITLGVFEGNATSNHVVIGDTFYSDDSTIKTGTMVNNGGVTETLYSGNAAYAVPEGYHDGTGIVGINVQTKSITVTSNGTTTVSPDSEKVLSGVSVTVDVPNQGVTPTGNINITDTSSVDVTNYATAQVVSGDLIRNNIRSGATILGVSGSPLVLDTSNADVLASDILSGKKAYGNGVYLTGTMTNRGAVSTDITAKAQEVTIASGYHNGSGKVKISSTEQAKIIAENIKTGITMLGIAGTFTNDADATAEDIANGKTAYVNGVKLTGIAAGGTDYATLNSTLWGDVSGYNVTLTNTYPYFNYSVNGGDVVSVTTNATITLTEVQTLQIDRRDGASTYAFATTLTPSTNATHTGTGTSYITDTITFTGDCTVAISITSDKG